MIQYIQREAVTSSERKGVMLMDVSTMILLLGLLVSAINLGFTIGKDSKK